MFFFGVTWSGCNCLAELRAQFLVESLADLKKNLIKRGLNLLIRHGKPEEILPSLAEAVGAYTVE
jgi:deoxyribodipyrimidine photo-lyase